MLYTTVKTLAVGYSSGNMPIKGEKAVKLSGVVDDLKTGDDICICTVSLIIRNLKTQPRYLKPLKIWT